MSRAVEAQAFTIWRVAPHDNKVISVPLDEIAHETRLTTGQVRNVMRIKGWRFGRQQAPDISEMELTDIFS